MFHLISCEITMNSLTTNQPPIHTPYIWMNIRKLPLPVRSISFPHCVTLKGYVLYILRLTCKALWTQFTLCACSCNRLFSSNLKGMLLAHICLHNWTCNWPVWWWGHIVWKHHYTVSPNRAVFVWINKFPLSFTFNPNKNDQKLQTESEADSNPAGIIVPSNGTTMLLSAKKVFWYYYYVLLLLGWWWWWQ